ncbi:MAG: TlpA family protein disulfide reductase [Oscillospiraceae bacterium]|jgi:thiol-disulfide isomerase/thioredoxin|nr:TlpA family protein disulfide reductase [Oscillospiraceae bacterium]
MKRIFAALLTFAMLFLAACTDSETENTQTTAPNGATAAAQGASGLALGNFETKDLKGNTFTNSIFAEYDLTLVNIWATWCPPCVGEIPELGELVNETRSEGVNIIGIVIDAVNERTFATDTATFDKAVQIMESGNADYTVLLPDEAMFSAVLKNVTSLPTTIFVDKNGTVVGKAVVGARSKEKWSAEIDKYLKLL